MFSMTPNYWSPWLPCLTTVFSPFSNVGYIHCFLVVVFFSDMRQVRSVVRNCLPDQQICTGDVCCNRYGAYPTCQQKCTSELCNDIDVETWRDDETSTACVILPEIMTLLFACTLLVLDALY